MAVELPGEGAKEMGSLKIAIEMKTGNPQGKGVKEEIIGKVHGPTARDILTLIVWQLS